MALPQYPAERRKELASQLGIDEQYLYQVLRRLKFASPALARRLHELDPAATLQDLQPDDWQLIWPELSPLPDAPVGDGALSKLAAAS